LLEHRRIRSTELPSASNLVHQMIDGIDEDLKHLNGAIETSPTTCCVSNEIKRLQALKNDIIDQAILTSRRLAENLDTIIQISNV
jgi:hypothetical protein